MVLTALDYRYNPWLKTLCCQREIMLDGIHGFIRYPNSGIHFSLRNWNFFDVIFTLYLQLLGHFFLLNNRVPIVNILYKPRPATSIAAVKVYICALVSMTPETVPLSEIIAAPYAQNIVQCAIITLDDNTSVVNVSKESTGCG